MSGFDESKIRRGQPGNAGQFASKPPAARQNQALAPDRAPHAVTIDGETTFEAAYVPDAAWNGFAMPYFDREQADRVAAWCSDQYDQYGPDVTVLEWEGDDLYEVTAGADGEPAERNRVDTRQLSDGSTVYGIGAAGWVWQDRGPTLRQGSWVQLEELREHIEEICDADTFPPVSIEGTLDEQGRTVLRLAYDEDDFGFAPRGTGYAGVAEHDYARGLIYGYPDVIESAYARATGHKVTVDGSDVTLEVTLDKGEDLFAAAEQRHNDFRAAIDDGFYRDLRDELYREDRL